MKQVRRGNKVLTIDDVELDGYLKEGFDELDDKGKVKTVSPNKTYTAAEVEKITAEYETKIAALTSEVEKLKKKLAKKGEVDEEAAMMPS